MTAIAPILITAASTLLVTLAAAFFGARFQDRREHEKWLREKRYEVCRDFLLLMYDYDSRQKVGATIRDSLAVPKDYFAQFRILGMKVVEAKAEIAFEAVAPLEMYANVYDWPADAVPKFDSEKVAQLQENLDKAIEDYVTAVHRTLRTRIR